MIGWILSRPERLELLKLIPAQFDKLVADHITFGRGTDASSLPILSKVSIVGSASDYVGVQAVIVELNGGIIRPDGSTFHITWSLDATSDRRPSESNEVISRFGWIPIDRPLEIKGLKSGIF